jgi:hypothetical protein
MRNSEVSIPESPSGTKYPHLLPQHMMDAFDAEQASVPYTAPAPIPTPARGSSAASISSRSSSSRHREGTSPGRATTSGDFAHEYDARMVTAAEDREDTKTLAPDDLIRCVGRQELSQSVKGASLRKAMNRNPEGMLCNYEAFH